MRWRSKKEIFIFSAKAFVNPWKTEKRFANDSASAIYFERFVRAVNALRSVLKNPILTG
jgi:hypothetical protein